MRSQHAYVTYGRMADRPGVGPLAQRRLTNHRGGASYDLFPIFPKGEIRKLGVVATARIVAQCFSEVNLANVAASGETIAQLLTFAPRRDALRVAQERYNRAVSALPSPGMAMLDRQC